MAIKPSYSARAEYAIAGNSHFHTMHARAASCAVVDDGNNNLVGTKLCVIVMLTVSCFVHYLISAIVRLYASVTLGGQ